MNIDFVAILNAAITESVGTLVAQQLKPLTQSVLELTGAVSTLADRAVNLTERVAALENGDVKLDDSSLTEIIEGLQRDVAIHDEHLKLLGAGLGERVADHMNDILLRGEGRFAENLKATLDGAIDEAFDERDWTAGSVGSAIDAAVNSAIEDIDFGQKVEDVLNAGRLDVTFRS